MNERSRRILVVEDERTIAESVAVRLRAEGFTVDLAYDGPTAVTRARAGKPDLVVHLARRPGAVLPRERLLAEVWGWADASGTRTVDSHVKALRRKLGADLIRTVHGVGYSLENVALENVALENVALENVALESAALEDAA